MIRKLRWKFVLTNMLMVSLILSAIAALVVTATRSTLRENTLSVLHRVAEEDGALSWPSSFRGPDINLPYFTVLLEPDGTVVLLDNHFGAVEDEAQLEKIVQSCIEQDKPVGALPDYRLRFLRQKRLYGWRICFVDASQEWSTMGTLFSRLGLIFAGTLVAFFLLSLLLSRWATQPVAESWRRQRQFVSDASHELKTPLTVIRSNVDLLQGSGGSLTEREQRWLDNIRFSSGQMTELVEELLTLARSDSQSQKPVREPVNLSELVEEAVLLFEAPLLEADRPLEDHITPGLFVTGDAAKLRRVTEILLDNAKKYARPHSTVTLHLEPEGQRRLRLSVNTKGDPIPPEQRERIFERFYRSDTARSSEGFGLGLSIARSVAQEHRGRIWVESSAEEGNTFLLSLPRTGAPRAEHGGK